jgi:hypothetical protein
VKVGGEASYCTIMEDFQTSSSDFSLIVLYGLGRPLDDVDMFQRSLVANAFSRYHTSAYPREYPVSTFSEYTIQYAITVKCVSERVAFSSWDVDLQESYGFECSSRFLVLTVAVSSCCHLETDMCLQVMTSPHKEGHVAFRLLAAEHVSKSVQQHAFIR